MKRVLLFCLVLGCNCLPHLNAQVYSPDRQQPFEQLVEQILPVPDEDLPYENLYESLMQLYTQPLDLNRTDAGGLRNLFILSESQIQSFVRHTERNGKLLSIYELQAIPGWDLQTIHQILPFVTIKNIGWKKSSQPLSKRINRTAQKMLLIRHERVVEERSGYIARNDSTPPAYTGSADKLHARFRLNHPGDFSFGFSAEKDAGEQLNWKPSQKRYGADFWSFHGILYEQGRWKKLAIGDFQLQYGQSLVFGSGFSFGKGAETVANIRRSNTGIRPYTSVLETDFYRGAAFTYHLSPAMDITAFYSNSPRDALLKESADTPLEEREIVFNSLQKSGLHRTINELSGRRSTREQSAGGILHYKGLQQRLQAGATFLFSRFSRPWQSSHRLYNEFEFNGQQNFIGSVFGEFNLQNAQAFVELARSKSGGLGVVGGTLLSLTHSLDFSFLFRKYDRHFHSFYGTAFAEGSRPINETGLYWGLQYKPLPKLSFSAYFDRFYFPWLRYRIDAPSDGFEYQLRAQYKIKRQWLIYAQFRRKIKSINHAGGSPSPIPLPGSKSNYLINLDYSGHKEISFRTRVQWSDYNFAGKRTAGYALVQDLNWHRKRWKLSARIALFQTDDYQNRQYVYEKDVLWAFSIPALYGTGIRNYLLAQYKISPQLTLWLRWARTRYTDREHISSGTEKIEGQSINQLKAQLRWMF